MFDNLWKAQGVILGLGRLGRVKRGLDWILIIQLRLEKVRI
jgi:hypothetical protein